jgi:ribosomal protein L15
MRLKKRKKASRMHGHGMGTHGWGARKKHISSGNQGGWGMSGTGKMAGHKKTLVTHLYGTSYFGKQGVTSRGSERKKNPVMNVADIELSLEMLKKKFGQKDGTLNLEDYKILGDGEITSKVSIKAKAASKGAIEKIEKAGGKIIIEAEEESEEKE